MAVSPAEKRQATRVVRALRQDYPDAECALVHENAFQLLIATILSAQCTDERVNMVTATLFQKYPTAADLAALPLGRLEKAIQSTGFFRNKAKSIKSCCQQLVELYDGQVPQDLDALVELPGVGRKTANVVLGTACGMATGVVVDTHVGRISRRLGLSAEKDAVKIEKDLMQLLPRKEWIDFSHRMIHHGRQVCKARKPRCEDCSMNSFCPRIDVESVIGEAALRRKSGRP
jgi:endonuclease-3